MKRIRTYLFLLSHLEFKFVLRNFRYDIKALWFTFLYRLVSTKSDSYQHENGKFIVTEDKYTFINRITGRHRDISHKRTHVLLDVGELILPGKSL